MLTYCFRTKYLLTFLMLYKSKIFSSFNIFVLDLLKTLRNYCFLGLFWTLVYSYYYRPSSLKILAMYRFVMNSLSIIKWRKTCYFVFRHSNNLVNERTVSVFHKHATVSYSFVHDIGVWNSVCNVLNKKTKTFKFFPKLI